MKIKNMFLWSIVLILTLSACSSSSNQEATNTSGTSSNQGTTSLSEVNKLLVGTLRLEDTDQAVSAEEAAQLLPLWQAYRSLSNSDTAAEAEVDGLLKQIQSTMTSDQIQAIEAMKLTSQDMMNLLQTMGGRMPQGTPNPQSTPGFDFPAGGFQGGNPPSGDASGGAGNPPSGSQGGIIRNFPPGGVVIQGGPGGDAGSAAGLGGGPMIQGTPDPSMQATAQARFSTQASGVNPILLDALITKLQAKSSGF